MYEPQPQPSKMEQTRQSFVRLINHKNEAEDGVLKILKHPDSTGEQIMEVRRVMLVVEESLHRVIPALRKQYPYPTISMVTRPWHRQEYDKYETSVDKTRAHDSASEEDSTTHEKE